MSAVNTQINDALLFVRWANPAAKNALNLAMYQQLAAALGEAQRRDDIKACVILGGEGDFCSGNDLAEFIQGRSTQVGDFFEPLVAFIRALARFDKPLLAAVDGWAVGIGATMLLHCDQVIASPQAQFNLPFTRLGLCCECGASLLLPLRIGQGRAADWLLRAAPISAQEALQAGFINRIEDEPVAAIRACALQLAERPLSALRAHKTLLKAPWQEALEQAMHLEEKTFFELLMGPEFRTILAAMSAKWRS